MKYYNKDKKISKDTQLRCMRGEWLELKKQLQWIFSTVDGGKIDTY